MHDDCVYGDYVYVWMRVCVRACVNACMCVCESVLIYTCLSAL